MKTIQNVKTTRTWISDEEFWTSPQLDGEIWKDFNQYKGVELSSTYQASNKGRVRRKGKSVIKGSISFDGYHEISMAIKNAGGRSMSCRTHIVILTIFQGPPPSDMQEPTVQHINHDKLDNRIENLCWMSAFDNNQERHGTRVKLIDDSGEYIFSSQKVASAHIGRYEDYISESISRGYKITDSCGKEVDVYLESADGWSKYVRPVPRNRNRCKINLDGSEHEFESYWQCDRFLNKDPGYITNRILNHWTILDNIDCTFYIYNHDTCDYDEYIPSKKNRPRNRRCEIVDSTGSHLFSSISDAAKYIRRDPEYLRVKIKEGKCIKNKDGEVIQARVLDNSTQ